MKHVTTANFPAVIHNSGVPVVVMFYASWCTKCAMMKPIAEEISGKYHAQYLFIEVDIDESPLLAKTYTDEHAQKRSRLFFFLIIMRFYSVSAYLLDLLIQPSPDFNLPYGIFSTVFVSVIV